MALICFIVIYAKPWTVLFLSVCHLQQRKLSFFFSGENANKLEFKEPAVLLDKKSFFVFFFKHYVKSLSLLPVFAKV